MADNGLKCPLFVLDHSCMRDIFEGRALRNKHFKAMIQRKANNLPFVAVTNMASFQRAMFLCRENIHSDNIRFVMDLITIHPSRADYKDQNAVSEEFTKFTKLVSEGAI